MRVHSGNLPTSACATKRKSQNRTFAAAHSLMLFEFMNGLLPSQCGAATKAFIGNSVKTKNAFCKAKKHD